MNKDLEGTIKSSIKNIICITPITYPTYIQPLLCDGLFLLS